MKRAGGIAGLAFIAAAALFASTALGAWQYRGEVADGHGTNIQLVVKHRGGNPKALLYAASGRLHLSCNRGGERRANVSEDFGALKLFDGRFGIDATEGLEGPNGRSRVKKYRFIGRVRRREAWGHLQVRLRVKHHQLCHSGRLRWHADFVPRAPSAT
jgi:hypothetical protein